MRMSFCVSASVSLKTGIPVHIETMSAISSSPISGFSLVSSLRQLSSSSRFFCVSFRSLSRSEAAFSNSCDSIACSFSVRTLSISSSSSRCRGGALIVLMRMREAASEDQDGVAHRRLVDADLLEAALEGGVALEVLPVLVQRRRADRLELAAGERRLQDRRGVDRALGGTCADEVVELVDEQDDVAALGDLLHHLLQALLELTAVLRARDQRREVERVDLLPLEELGNLVRGDARGKALDDGGLPDPRLSDQHRVVLGAADED